MHWIGNTAGTGDEEYALYECDTCGVAVSDPDLHKSYMGHDS